MTSRLAVLLFATAIAGCTTPPPFHYLVLEIDATVPYVPAPDLEEATTTTVFVVHDKAHNLSLADKSRRVDLRFPEWNASLKFAGSEKGIAYTMMSYEGCAFTRGNSTDAHFLSAVILLGDPPVVLTATTPCAGSVTLGPLHKMTGRPADPSG